MAQQLVREHDGIGIQQLPPEIMESPEIRFPVRVYDWLPQYENIDLEKLKKMTAMRKRALQIVEVAHKECVHSALIRRRLDNCFLRDTEVELIGLDKQIPTKEDRENDIISHWTLRLAYCRHPFLRDWFVNNEIKLFKYRFHALSDSCRGQFIQETMKGIKEVPDEMKTNEFIQTLQECNNIRPNRYGRQQLWAFIREAGMSLQEALEFTFDSMTAYTDPKAEFDYQVKYAYGKVGQQKITAAATCGQKINTIKTIGEHHHCPFNNLADTSHFLPNWGIRREEMPDIESLDESVERMDTSNVPSGEEQPATLWDLVPEEETGYQMRRSTSVQRRAEPVFFRAMRGRLARNRRGSRRNGVGNARTEQPNRQESGKWILNSNFLLN
ncbi:Oidioi.mRNA.OKI2018_I69.chr2.g5898.t1.cds [Oikopleura dioica]|uniref:Oidioi.mRNA.OKI2018_I69.chr2.g5898.t1.cds n=1 Tax=Oikopleura dioica TaxID=34765 RepID=A0ABN7T654_OIKDI|nr:Oidioi.mRNA.OKI2018_I69.chr2.g5898.t1.cds [Oikopleura dioica]